MKVYNVGCGGDWGSALVAEGFIGASSEHLIIRHMHVGGSSHSCAEDHCCGGAGAHFYVAASLTATSPTL